MNTNEELLKQRADLLKALKRLVDRDLTYFNDYVSANKISAKDVDHARAIIRKVEQSQGGQK